MGGCRCWSAGSAVADVTHSWCGAGVLDEDLAIEVGDGEVVAVVDDQDVLERVLAATMKQPRAEEEAMLDVARA